MLKRILILSGISLFCHTQHHAMQNQITTFGKVLALPGELQNKILPQEEVTIIYDADRPDESPKLRAHDAKFIKDNNIIYDATITLPVELDSDFKNYILLNAIRYQYRADTRSESYHGTLNQQYFDNCYAQFKNHIFDKKGLLTALTIQTLDKNIYVIQYGSLEAIGYCPYKFFLHKLHTSNADFITAPHFNKGPWYIAQEFYGKEYEKIVVTNATDAMMLVSNDEYKKYNAYSGSRRAAIKIADGYNYELLPYLARIYTQDLNTQEDTTQAIKNACNALRFFHRKEFAAGRAWLQHNQGFLNMITRMRGTLIKKIVESNKPLAYLQDITVFPKNIKGAANITKLINIFKVKTNPEALAVYGSLNSLVRAQNMIDAFDNSCSDKQKIDALYRFCNIAQEIAYNLDYSFKPIGNHSIHDYKNVLQSILDHTLSDDADDAYKAALELLKGAINDACAPLQTAYNSLEK